MSESPKTPAAAPYTPSGAAASERMLSSVLGRVHGPYGAPIGRSLHFADRLVGGIVEGAGPTPGRGPAERLFAQPVSGKTEAPKDSAAKSAPELLGPRRERLPPPKDLLTVAPESRRGADLKLPRSLRPSMTLSSPERMFGSDSKSARESLATPGSEQPGQPVLGTGWDPPAAHAASEFSRSAEAGAPLWGSLPRPTLEPLVAAVEADLGRAETQRHERPAMEILQGGSGRRPERPSAMTEEQAHQTALESSKRLMDAVRAHAMANGGSDDRISLGDMTLIAFADSNNQMAAASSFTSNAPDHQPSNKTVGDLPHPKIEEGLPELHKKLQMMAKLVAHDLKQVQKLSKDRFGANG